MATYNGTTAVHQTLTGTTADVITFASVPSGCQLVVLNRTAADMSLSVSWDPNTQPTVLTATPQADCNLILASSTRVIKAPSKGFLNACIVSLRGNNNAYSLIIEPGG